MSLFIAFEGLDGCGKSTQSRRLVSVIPGALWTAEPTDEPAGRLIRQILRKESPLTEATLPYLFAADRQDHLERLILPALAEGKTVITDRYYGSSMAYQSQVVPLGHVLGLNSRFRAPDLTFFLDFSPEAAMERIASRGEKIEYFENLERLRGIAAAYAVVMATLSQRGEQIIRLDASQNPDELHQQVLSVVQERGGYGPEGG